MRSSTYINHPFHRPFWRFLAIIVAGVLLASLVRTLWYSWKTYQNIQEQERSISAQEAEVSRLEEAVKEASSSFQLEKRARNDLRLQLPDEHVINVKK